MQYIAHTFNFSLILFYFSLNVRIILLVRDPRGTLQSRKHRDWCPGQPDCDQPEILCDDLVDDYFTAINFTEKYPQRFK